MQPSEHVVSPTVVDFSTVDAADVARELAVDPEVGLSSTEAAGRLRVNGSNEIRGVRPIPTWRKILAQFHDPLIYLLLAATAISTVAWVAEGAEGAPIDAIVIGAIVVLNAVLGFVQQARAANAVAALGTMTAASSTVMRDGALVTVHSADIVRGDILVLGEGDSVGADGRLLTASALRIAEASLTGESEAVSKGAATLTGPLALGERLNMVFGGTAVVQGVGRAVVTGTGMGSEMGAIATMLDATVEEPTPLQNEVSRIGRMLGVIVVVIAIVVMGTIIIVDGVRSPSDLVVVLLLGVSLAVAAVPEGLPAILSVVLAIGVQKMAKRKAVVKKLSSVEALGSASVICTDKTGTLTRNEMTIERVLTASGRVRITGVGYVPVGDIRFDDGESGSGELNDAVEFETRLALGAGCLANNAQLTEVGGAWQIHGDPTEASFLVAAAKLAGGNDAFEQSPRQAELPFTSDRKMMSTLHPHSDGGRMLFSKGAPDVLLGRCSFVQVGNTAVPLSDELRRSAIDDVEVLSAESYRTLGVAYRKIVGHEVGDGALDGSLEHDLVYAGVVGIIDPPRAEAADAIAVAQTAGIRVIMITGDHPLTAARIASDLGIITAGGTAITGAQLDELDDTELRETIRKVSVYARVSPKHKLRLVDALQADGQIVAMTGDGVNDAPALKSADIGVAMGVTGTEVTKEAARMILGDDNFATIVAAVRQGRNIFDNIRKFLRYLLSSNMGEVLTVFLGVSFAGVLGLNSASTETIVLPLLATQILWINLITDSAPALAMGIDPEVDDVMLRRPRKLTDRAIDVRMWGGILSIGFVMAAVTLLTIDLFLPGGFIAGDDTLEVARTAGFSTLVFAQLFNALNARSESTSAFRGLFRNKWLWGSIVLGVLLQVAVVEMPLLQVAFGTASLDAAHWATCVGLASIVLWFDEVRKIVLRGRARVF